MYKTSRAILAILSTRMLRTSRTIFSASTTPSPQLTLLTKWYQSYVHSLKTTPIPTKSLTAFVIGGAADTVAQSLTPSSERKSLSLQRILAFATCSALITAPMYHHAYTILERTTKSIPLMVFIDSVCLTPIWYVMYIPCVTVLSGGGHKVKDAMIDNAKPVATLSVTALPPLEAINFAYVPLHLRVPFMCCVDFVFTAAVSYIANRKHKSTKLKTS